jgi:esterase/lipase superfamily enzyme
VHGGLERPTWWSNIWRPLLGYGKETDEDHFRIHGIVLLTRERLIAELSSRADSRHPNSVLLFIHGYNTSFEDAIFRAAQIAYDANFEGKVLVFSWPSAGDLSGYPYDEDSGRLSVGHLLTVLQVLKELKDEHVYVVAHSLGNQILVDTLARAALSKVNLQISELVMAAPDVDKRVFEDNAAMIASVAKNMTMYASAADKALIVSGRFHRDMRIGFIGPDGPNLVDGIETIDVTAVGDDMFDINHSIYAAIRPVLEDLAHIIGSEAHEAPDRRSRTLKFMPDREHVKYWLFPR